MFNWKLWLSGVLGLGIIAMALTTGFHVARVRSAFAQVFASVPMMGGGGVPTTMPPPSTTTTASASIGAAGGTVATSDNSAAVVVPPGAFSTTVTMSLNSISISAAPPPPTGFATAAVWSIDTGGVEPTKAVLATFKYSPAVLGSMNPHRVGVYLYSSADKSWTWVGGVINSSAQTISAQLAHFSNYGLQVNTTVFADIYQTPWAQDAVDTLLGANVVAGVAPGLFEPESDVTRAQFATLLVKADGLAPVASGQTPFADVPTTAWYAPYVAAAYNAGLLAGTSPTTFDPNGDITRAQMAVMLGKLLGSSAPTGTLSSFSDASAIPTWAQTGVQRAVGTGLMTGFPGGTFQPAGLTTRAQAAVVLAGYLKYIGKV